LFLLIQSVSPQGSQREGRGRTTTAGGWKVRMEGADVVRVEGARGIQLPSLGRAFSLVFLSSLLPPSILFFLRSPLDLP
jgi:hypothetical protein